MGREAGTQMSADELASWAMSARELNLSSSSEYMKELIEEGEEFLRELRGREVSADDPRVKGILARLSKAEELLRQRLIIEARERRC